MAYFEKNVRELAFYALKQNLLVILQLISVRKNRII